MTQQTNLPSFEKLKEKLATDPIMERYRQLTQKVHQNEKLLALYDEYIKFTNFSTQFSNNVKPINSNFLVNISNDDVDIYINSKINSINKDFSLLHSTHNSGKYKCKCNSNILFDVINKNEDQIFKKIFVKIEDCPEWMRESLYELREKQVQDQLIEERTKQTKQFKKQKRLELKNKFFPFFKK